MSATNELQTNRLDGAIDDGVDLAQKFSDFEAALRTIFGIPADTAMSQVMSILKDIDYKAAAYKWTASGSGTNEYYCELATGGDPSIANPINLYLYSTIGIEGTAGSLANFEWDYGNNDTLGYNTLYVRSDAGDPDGVTAMTITSGGDITMVGTLTSHGDAIAAAAEAATKGYVQNTASGMGITRARAYLSSDGTTSSNIYIPWDAADINENSVWSVSNPTRLTIPSGGAGDYMVGFSISTDKVSATDVNRFYLSIYKNRTRAYNMKSQATSGTAEIGVSGLIYLHDLVAADFLELKIALLNSYETTVYAANTTFWMFNLE